MDAKAAAQTIRATLKARGWNQRKVSVRVRPCTYSSVIAATIYDASVPVAEVKAILQQHESVRRCEMTGDVLMGGNTHIDVEYELGVLDALTAEIKARIEKGEQEIRGYTVVYDTVYERWTAYGNGADLQTFWRHDVSEMAQSIAFFTAGRADTETCACGFTAEPCLGWARIDGAWTCPACQDPSAREATS